MTDGAVKVPKEEDFKTPEEFEKCARPWLA
jgi:hypothetical protein